VTVAHSRDIMSKIGKKRPSDDTYNLPQTNKKSQ